MVEAGLSFGSTNLQLLKKVQLPQALPTIMVGVNQTTMMALAMVVVASMVGVEGLGLEVLTALNQIDVAKGFEADISIVINICWKNFFCSPWKYNYLRYNLKL
ncbi:ABC transporter permease subunit [Oceanobacillus rekensis]|uniref:ABC transporter permease subunit n=1 Tax=Oceanobacillus rekensis TaxID=937927 RepID=UPI000B43F633|nr:ABC transporter permease subunit [Oceanobacillus rekensis]